MFSALVVEDLFESRINFSFEAHKPSGKHLSLAKSS